jgi:hypothetical protein
VNTLPAVPDTTAGDVTGRLEMLASGELVVRLRPARVRDVTATPVDQEPVHRHYRGCECRLFGLYYVGPVTPELRTETERLDAYWMNPPWWSTLRWIPSQRRLRALEKRERARPAAAQRLELEREGTPDGATDQQ